MTSWWLAPVAAMVVAAVVAAIGVRRLRAVTAGLTDDTAALAATGTAAADLAPAVAAVRARLDRFPGTGAAPGDR